MADGGPRIPRWGWVLIWSGALASRICAALVLPNAEQDGYSYAETIHRWTTELRAGTFRITDLFGFWLPGFQFASALLHLILRNSLGSGKAVSAISGAISCVLVFRLTLRITGRTGPALAAFLLLLVNPLHLICSAASMTDVPFGCLVLASVWFASRRRWILAAIMACLAQTVRLEGWALILALPLLQLSLERRVSIGAAILLLAWPISWLAISYSASGDWLGYFTRRAVYQHHFLEFHPTRRGFDPVDLNQDADFFFLGANPVVFLLLLAGAAMVLGCASQNEERFFEVRCLVVFSAALFLLLMAAYVTKSQPVILPRYGLIFYVLGLPVTVWLGERLWRKLRPRWAAAVILLIALGLGLQSTARQVPLFAKIRSEFVAQSRIGRALRQAAGESPCFSDDPAVRVLIELEPSRFVRTETTPPDAAANAAKFDDYLRKQNVGFLVFMRTEDSLPVKFHPELGNEPGNANGFELIDMARSTFGPDVWLYRLSKR